MSEIHFKKCFPLFRYAFKVQQYCIVFFLLSIGFSVAKPPIAFKKYTVMDGLSHNYVRNVLQDSEGFIWLATEDGLNKFNSYTFQVYRHIPGDSNSITNHPILALEEDKDHNVWIGTWGGGIFIYNRKLDNFSRIQDIQQTNASHSLGTNFVYDLFRDAKGRMWAGTGGGGLVHINPDNHKYTYYRHSSGNPASLSNDKVMSVTEDKEGRLWLGTYGGGVNEFDPETGIFKHHTHQADNSHSISHNDVYVVFCDSKQRLWAGTWDNGLSMMEENTGKFIHFKYQPGHPGSIGNNQIWSITETNDGSIWIGTDRGLALYNEKEKNFHVYRNDPFDAKSLVGNSVKSLYADKMGRLWVGTVNAGVSMFDKHFVSINHFYTKLNENSLSHNDVSAFLPMAEGKIAIGTDGGGLNILDRSANHFVHYKHAHTNDASIGSDKIKDVLLDRKNRLWIGFWGGGFDYFDQDRQVFLHFRKNSPHPNGGLNSNNVTSLAEDQDGYIWIATYGGGLNKFDPKSKTFTYYTQQAHDPGSLSDRQIWTVLVDHQNNVWVGTSSGQLDLFDRENERFIHVFPQQLRESGYSVQVLFEDSKKRMWVGLEGGGLQLLDRATMTFTTYTTEHGLPSNNINAIEESYDGHLWLSTNHGITRFDPETGQCKNFDLSDGLQGLHYNRNASGKLESGEMLFGGINGFNMFHPDSLTDTISEAPIVFTDFQIFNKPVPIGGDSPLQAHINETDTVTLSYKQSVFSLEYAELNYTAPEKVRYQYRLKGFVDETWQDAGTERKVTYTNLQPGNYTFEVTTFSDHGTPFPARTLAIFVAPPWWHTWWARILIGVLFGAVLLAVYRLRLQNIKNHNKRLEEEVAERTTKLKNANLVLTEMNLLIQQQKEEILSQAQELAESNEEIKSINQQLEERVELRTADLKKSNEELDNFVYRVSHDIRAPLSSVLGLVELMAHEKDPAQLKQYLQMAASSVNKLDGFVKDILNYARNSRMKIERQEINFSALLDNVLEELQYMSHAGRLRIIRDIQIKSPHYNDPRRLHIIFRNLFSNAIKYQNMREPDPYVRIKITTEKEEAVITVEDNGIGIAADQVDKVFDMFHRGSDVSTGSGIGLYIVKETVEKLCGCICLQSSLGAGTTFTIKLPNLQEEA